jgi:hypothetical protein
LSFIKNNNNRIVNKQNKDILGFVFRIEKSNPIEHRDVLSQAFLLDISQVPDAQKMRIINYEKQFTNENTTYLIFFHTTTATAANPPPEKSAKIKKGMKK